MARRIAAPSSRPRRGRRRPSNSREWLGGIQLSGFAAILLGLVVFGALVLVPTVSSYVDMRQQIAQAQQGVQLTTEEIAQLQLERDQWRDPAFIQSEARERLFYMNPGEIVYLIQDDLPVSDDEEPSIVAPEAAETESDWMGSMLRTVVGAGLAEQATPVTK
jgi:cell division protein FtsB